MHSTTAITVTVVRRMIPFLFGLFLCANAYSAQYRAALVADMDTGRVLYQENANQLNYPASLTKIMTLYLLTVLQQLNISVIF